MYVSGGCIIGGMQSLGPEADSFIAGSLMAVFTLSSIGVAFVFSSHMAQLIEAPTRRTWWGRLLEFNAKLYAALTGFAASVILLGIIYGLRHYAVTGHP